MKRISSLQAPALAGVIQEKSAHAAIAEIHNCKYHGADMIDLHLSCLEDCSVAAVKKIVKSTSLPILALNYNQTWEKEALGLDEESRVQTLLNAVEAGAAGIDMQGYTFHEPSKSAFCGENRYSFTEGNPKEVVTDPQVIQKQCDLIELVHSKDAEVLLSCHPGIVMHTDQVLDLARFLEQRNPDIIKIVTKATCPEDLEESIRTMMVLKREMNTPVSYHTNGKAGIPSRIINPLLGGQIAFCVDRYHAGSTMEQLHLPTVRAIVDNTRRIY